MQPVSVELSGDRFSLDEVSSDAHELPSPCALYTRGRGALQDARDLGATFVKSIGGTPIYVRDVGTVDLDHMVPSGVYGKDDRSESVEGIVLMRKGENPSVVLEAVRRKVIEINDKILPKGMKLLPFDQDERGNRTSRIEY